MSGINGITNERLLSLERQIAQLRASADRHRVRIPSGGARPSVRWAKTVAATYGEDYPGDGNTFAFIFVQRSFTETEGTHTPVTTVLGDETEPVHFLNSNRYIDEGDIVPVFEADGQWWEFDETSEGAAAKLVKLHTLKPAFEVEDTGTYTFTLPSTTAPSYTRDSGTGELTLNADSNTIINAAPMNYWNEHSRSRLALVVPVDGGYVPIPLATDPRVPYTRIHFGRRNASSSDIQLQPGEGLYLSSDEFYTGVTGFGDSGGVDDLPLDSDESCPLFARPVHESMFLMQPGRYLIFYMVEFGNYADGTPETLTTSSASGHTHDVTLESTTGEIGAGLVWNNIDAASSSVATSSLAGKARRFINVANIPASGAFVSGWEIHQVLADLKPKRISLTANFRGNSYDAGDPPTVRVVQGEMICIPLSWYNTTDDVTEERQHQWTYNPYSTGSFVWHQGYSAPAAWDRTGA